MGPCSSLSWLVVIAYLAKGYSTRCSRDGGGFCLGEQMNPFQGAPLPHPANALGACCCIDGDHPPGGGGGGGNPRGACWKFPGATGGGGGGHGALGKGGGGGGMGHEPYCCCAGAL